MNAKRNFSDFALEIVLTKLSQIRTKNSKSKMESLTIELVDEDPYDRIGEYKEVLRFLKKLGVIEKYENKGKAGYFEDYEIGPHDIYTYAPKCFFRPKKFEEFLIEQSIIPKYYLGMGKDRRVILNEKFVIVKPQFNSTNFYFIEYALKNSGKILTKENLQKTSGNIEKRFHTILEQLKMTSELKCIFFPNVAADAAEFRNNLTVKDLSGSKINESKLNRFLKKLHKV